jgi:hypothetical protein
VQTCQSVFLCKSDWVGQYVCLDCRTDKTYSFFDKMPVCHLHDAGPTLVFLSVCCAQSERRRGAAEAVWRLDKDDVSGIFVRMRQNLLALFARGGPQLRRLRDLVVDLLPPEAAGGSDGSATLAEGLASHLDPDQRLAAQRCVWFRGWTL